MSDEETAATGEFGKTLGEHYDHLTKSEKRIANYLRRSQDEAAFLSAGEVADRLGLSEATVVRFARTLEFASYPAMRAVLQENFRRRVTHSVRLRGRLDELRKAGDIFERLVVSEIDYLTQALETVDRQALHQVVELVRAHERIFIFGAGPSVSLVDLMSIRLSRFGRQIVPLTSTGREIIEPLLSMSAKDMLLIICFFDLTPALQVTLDRAREVSCPVVLLTDTLGSVIGEKADLVLAARRGPVAEFHSLVVPMTIINTLLLAVASEGGDRVLATLDQLDQLRERLKAANRQLT
jgi:DNA-binding MurR/RpiR family transcriptional regulator